MMGELLLRYFPRETVKASMRDFGRLLLAFAAGALAMHYFGHDGVAMQDVFLVWAPFWFGIGFVRSSSNL